MPVSWNHFFIFIASAYPPSKSANDFQTFLPNSSNSWTSSCMPTETAHQNLWAAFFFSLFTSFTLFFLFVFMRAGSSRHFLSLFTAFASSNFFYFWSFEQKWSSCVCYLYVDSKVPKRRRWCTSKPQRPTAVPLMSTGGWLISYLFIFLRKTCFQFYSHIWEKNGWHAQIVEYLMGPRQLVFRIRLSFLFLK